MVVGMMAMVTPSPASAGHTVSTRISSAITTMICSRECTKGYVCMRSGAEILIMCVLLTTKAQEAAYVPAQHKLQKNKCAAITAT
jgi:hypothetical protein